MATEYSSYTRSIAKQLGVTLQRARFVEAWLRLQYGTLDALSQEQIKYEYENGGPMGPISAAIDESTDEDNEELAKSEGL